MSQTGSCRRESTGRGITVKHSSSKAALFGRESVAIPATVTRERNSASAARLTPRQLEALALLCEGLPNTRIGRRPNIATGTVEVHVNSILSELGV